MAFNKDKPSSDRQNCDLDQFKDLCQKDCNSNRDVRNLRNLAEKQRRDKLNGYINELANSVPLVTMSSKRLDKTSVLRLSAAYLRLNKTTLNLKRCQRTNSKKSQSNNLWRPTKFNFSHLKQLLDSVDGFIVVTTGQGKIIYVSHSVEKFLGHQNIEMIGHSLTSFLHPSDIESVCSKIQNAQEQVCKGSQMSDKISFQCRLREKNQPRSEVITYQMVNVSGHISSSEVPKDALDENSPKCSTSNDNEDKNAVNTLFKGFVQIIPTNPMAELSLMDADLDEYVSRHSLDGTLLFVDHRICGIIGFLPSEVLGKSAYSYIYPDDHSISLFAHKLMLSNSNGTGNIVHRLKTKSGPYVFAQSSGCLQYDKNGQIDHWVCVTRLLVENEGDKERDKFVKRFTPHIHNTSPTALYESLQIVIGPRGSKSSFSATNSFLESNSSNSVKIQEIHSPPPPQPQQTNVSLNNQNSLTFTSLLPVTTPQQQPQKEVQIPIQMNTREATQQSQQQLTNMGSICPESIGNPVIGLESNVQSSSLIQIQTLPIFPIAQAQVTTRQTCSSVYNHDNLSLNTSNNNNSISDNLVKFYAPAPVSVSYTDLKNSNLNNSSFNANNISAMKSVSTTPVVNVGNASITSKPTNDLTHLLGATVLTFDSQQRPVLSTYSPSVALEEVSRINQNHNQNNVNINLSSKLNCPDSSDISPSMETSFYSPLVLNCDDLSIEPQREQLTLNGLNYEELSNHSTNSLLSFSFPSNDSQCDFGFIEDQSIEENLLQDPYIPMNGTSDGDKRNGVDSNEVELDRAVETETSIFNLQNTETSSSAFFSSKRNTTQL